MDHVKRLQHMNRHELLRDTFLGAETTADGLQLSCPGNTQAASSEATDTFRRNLLIQESPMRRLYLLEGPILRPLLTVIAIRYDPLIRRLHHIPPEQKIYHIRRGAPLLQLLQGILPTFMLLDVLPNQILSNSKNTDRWKT